MLTYLQGIFHFLKEIKTAFPNLEYYERKNYLIKDVIEWAKERGFTDIMLFYEKHGKPRKLTLNLTFLQTLSFFLTCLKAPPPLSEYQV